MQGEREEWEEWKLKYTDGFKRPTWVGAEIFGSCTIVRLLHLCVSNGNLANEGCPDIILEKNDQKCDSRAVI